jgi:hypothetical protein
MLKIKFDGFLTHDLVVDVTYHDSNEELEIDCNRQVSSFKFGEQIYQYFDVDAEVAFEKFKKMIKSMADLSPVKTPDVVFCVVTKFKSEFFIGWAAIERHYAYQNSRITTEE